MNKSRTRTILTTFLLGFAIFACSAPTAYAAPSAKVDLQIQELQKSKTEDQGAYFANMVAERFKYVTAHSYSGKSGQWMAFVDLFEAYQDGKPNGEMLVQRATVQYGLSTLPSAVRSCTISIDEESSTMKVGKDKAMFSFPTSTSDVFQSNGKNTNAKVSVSAGKQSVNFALTHDYPSEDFSDIDKVLSAMAPSYVAYAEKQDASFDHAVLRLRSYVEGSDKLSRVYSWELFLIEEDRLPSKAIVIRYDCDTETASTALRREIKSYFA